MQTKYNWLTCPFCQEAAKIIYSEKLIDTWECTSCWREFRTKAIDNEYKEENQTCENLLRLRKKGIQV